MAPRKTTKAKSSKKITLRDYELIVIANPELDEENHNTTINKIEQFISEREGSIADTERWGKKRLAYPIKNFHEGNYTLSQVKLKPETTSELEASLQISEEILRYLLIRKESVQE